MAFDHKRLRQGEMIAGVAAVLLFIDLFLNWFGVKVSGAVGSILQNQGISTSANAWTTLEILSLFLLLVILVTLALVALRATQSAPALPISAAVIVTALGALATLLLLYRVLLNEPGPDNIVTQKLGAYLGLLLTAALTYGGYRAMREEGTSLGDAKAQAEAAVASRGRSVPGSPSGGDAGASSSSSTTPVPPAASPPPPVAPPAAPPASPPPPAAPPVAPPPPPAAPDVGEGGLGGSSQEPPQGGDKI